MIVMKEVKERASMRVAQHGNCKKKTSMRSARSNRNLNRIIRQKSKKVDAQRSNSSSELDTFEVARKAREIASKQIEKTKHHTNEFTESAQNLTTLT